MLELRNVKPNSVDVFDGGIFIGTIYTHGKNTSPSSASISTKRNATKKALRNLGAEDEFPPTEIDFLI